MPATDAAGGTTIFACNSHGQVLTVIDHLNQRTASTYETDPLANGYGRVTSITGPVPGSTTTFTNDALQRVRSMTDSAGYTITSTA